VIKRVAMLPLARDARITLVHIVPKRLAASATRLAKRDAKRMLEAHAEQLARALPESVRVRQVVRVGDVQELIAELAEMLEVELIVTGRRDGRHFRDAFFGATAERIIRTARRPVLMVRRTPRSVYRHPAIALDADSATHGAIAGLLRLIQPSPVAVDVIYAYHIPYEGLVYPSLAPEIARARRAEHRRDAQSRLTKTLAEGLAHAKVSPDEAPRLRLHVHHGDPRSVIEMTVKNTAPDLLVLGTHGYTGTLHTFIGSVAGDTLRAIACDALVVPPGRTR
jgi:nucleotide-binding universal stress UspA family protein